MGNKKLVYCCIIGIVLGYIVPLILKTDPHSSLMIGMVGGLAVGYLLDSRDSRKNNEEGQVLLNEKADRANKLMERARRGVDNEYLRMEYDDEETETPAEQEEEVYSETEGTDPVTPAADYDEGLTEEEQKLNDAEELLRAARERMNK